MARILLAEDDLGLRRLFVEILREAGHTVDETGDGAAALELLRERHPDVIVLDLRMPIMDGWAFVEAHRREPAWSEIPIVILSAVPSLFEATKNLPVRAVLTKPVELSTLLVTVGRLTRAAGT